MNNEIQTSTINKQVTIYVGNLQEQLAEVKNDIKKEVAKYSIAVTDENYQEAKKFMANINKEKSEFNAKCKGFLEAVMQPLEVFKEAQKEIIAIYEQARSDIKEQVDIFDNERKKIAREVLSEYLQKVCDEKELNSELITIDDLIMLTSITSTNTIAKKAKEAIDNRVALVENEILKTKIEEKEKAERERKIAEEAKRQAELEYQRKLEEAKRQAELEKKQAVANAQKQTVEQPKQETTIQPQEQEQNLVQDALEPFEPTTKTTKTQAILVFEFDIKGSNVTDEQIADRCKAQIGESLMKYLKEVRISKGDK